MVGLILGVLRFPLIIGAETSIGVAAGTNIGISTMAAIPAAVRHLRQNNVNTRIFLTMAITGAVGAFCGSLLTTYVIIVSYESVVLITGKSKIRIESDTKDESMSKNKTISLIFGTDKTIDFLILVVMGFAAMVGGYIGASYTHRFSERNLKRIIGIVLIVVAITMFIRVATVL